MRNATLITAAQFEPVTLAELKTQVQIASDYREHDVELTGLIIAAREQYEHDTSRILCGSTWRAVFDAWPVSYFELGTQSVTAITSIKYIDASSVQQTVSSSVYVLDTAYPMPRVRLAYNQQWPTTRGETGDIEITYTAGAATQAAVTARDKQAVLMLAASWFENRTGMIATNSQESPVGYGSLVRSRMRSTYP
jgi:uncharacterized phiE125 gp8 family phage protein